MLFYPASAADSSLLTTRNAIRILEMYDYPRDLIAEAYEVQEKLTEKSN